MDYTFRVRLSHVQVTSLTTLVQLISGTPPRVACFRLAFDGKVEDLPLEPDLITGDLTSSRGIRFVYRIRADGPEALEQSLARRYATCQVLLKERTSDASPARPGTSPDAFTVVAVLASATASVLELVRAPDPHFLFTLTEVASEDADNNDDHDGQADPYYIDSTDASVYKEDEAGEDSHVGAILGRKDGLVSLQIAVEEMRVVDVGFRQDVRVTALPPLTTVRLAYKVRHMGSTPSAEQSGCSQASDCRAQGYTLSAASLTTSASGEATFTEAQLPRLAPSKFTPHDLAQHELEVCILVSDTVYTSLHCPLRTAQEGEPVAASRSTGGAAVSLSLSHASLSDWDESGTTVHGAVTLGNVPCFLQAREAAEWKRRQQKQAQENSATDANRASARPLLSLCSPSYSPTAQDGLVSLPAMLAPGAVILGNVKEQALRPVTRFSAAPSLTSSLCVAGPSAPAKEEDNDKDEVPADEAPMSGTLNDSQRVPEMDEPPTDDSRPQLNASSMMDCGSPPERLRTMIKHDMSSFNDAQHSAPPLNGSAHPHPLKTLPSPLPPPTSEPVEETRILPSPNASNINAELHELHSVGDDDGGQSMSTDGTLSAGTRSRRSSAAEAAHASVTTPNSTTTDRRDTGPSAEAKRDSLVNAEGLRAQPSPRPELSTSRRVSTTQHSATSRGSVTAVSEELVLHFHHPSPPNGAPLPTPPDADAAPRRPSSTGKSSEDVGHSEEGGQAPSAPLTAGREASPQPRLSSTVLSTTPSPAPAGSSSPSLAPPWQPGPEPPVPVPRLAAEARAPPKSTAGFARPHAKLVADSHAFHMLLATYATQARRVNEAETALAAHDARYPEAPQAAALTALKAEEHDVSTTLAAAQADVKTLTTQLERAREAVAATADVDGAPDNARLSPEETEKVALYADMTTGLLDLLARAERHRDELTAARDRHSLHQLALAQAALEADAVRLAQLPLAPAPPPMEPHAALRRRESVNLAPNTSALVAEEVTPLSAPALPAPPLSSPPPLHERRPSPLHDAPLSSATPPSPLHGPHTPSPPSERPPDIARPRSRSPLYCYPACETTSPPDDASSSPPPPVVAGGDALASPPRAGSVTFGWLQPCTPEAERRARAEWQTQRETPPVAEPPVLTRAASAVVTNGIRHPYGGPAVVDRAQSADQAPLHTSPTLRYGAAASVVSSLSASPSRPVRAAGGGGGQTELLWRSEAPGPAMDAWSEATGISRRHSLVVASPVVNLFPRLGSTASSVERGRQGSPVPTAPAPGAAGSSVLAHPSPHLTRPPPLAAMTTTPTMRPRSALASIRPTHPTTTATPTTGEGDDHFIDAVAVVRVGGGVRQELSRRSSVLPDSRASTERSPPHPYSVARDFDGAAHYPLVSADAAVVSSSALQVRALLQAIADGDVALALYLISHYPDVLRGSDNFLHAACAAVPARARLVTAILDVRPELARGVDRESGNTALHVACASSVPDLHVIRQLIVAGVDGSTLNGQGYTAFHVAVLNTADALTHAVKEMLLTIGGATVNERAASGQTALHLVAGSDECFTVVQFLVTHGADLWAQAPLDLFVGSPYGYKGRQRVTKTVTPPEAASLKGAIRNGRYFDRSLMNSRIVF